MIFASAVVKYDSMHLLCESWKPQRRHIIPGIKFAVMFSM